MSLNHIFESLAAIIAICAFGMPGADYDLVGGLGISNQNAIPECTTVGLTGINCQQLGAACTGTIQVCDGCGTGRKIGLCKHNPTPAQPCTGGAVICASFEHSKMYTFVNQGQACVPQDCPATNGGGGNPGQRDTDRR